MKAFINKIALSIIIFSILALLIRILEVIQHKDFTGLVGVLAFIIALYIGTKEVTK